MLGKRRAQALPERSSTPISQPSGRGRGRKWAQGRLREGAHPPAPGGWGLQHRWPGALAGRATWEAVGGRSVCCGTGIAPEVCSSPEATGHTGFSGWLGKGTETGWRGWADLEGFLAAVWQLGLPGSGRVPGRLKEPPRGHSHRQAEPAQPLGV